MSIGDTTLWSAPNFSPPAKPAAPSAAQVEAVPLRIGPSVEELAAIEKAARDEGFAQGKAEGLAAGQAEIKRLQDQLAAIVRGFVKPMADFDHEVAEALGVLAVQIAGVLTTDAYAADPQRLADLVASALAEVAGEEREAEIRLSPQDHALLNGKIDTSGARLIADNSLARGSVRVHTPNVRIDATLQSRLAAALAQLTVTEEPV